MSICSVHELFFSEGEKLSVKVDSHSYVSDEKECRNVRFEIENGDVEIQVSISKQNFKKLINKGKEFLDSEKAESA